MAAIEPRPIRQKSRYFLVASCIALAVVFTGFLTTFILPSFRGTFSAPAVIYIHGGFLFVWTLLLLVQSMLVRSRKIRLHQSIGYATIFVAVGVIFSTMAVGVYTMRRDLAAGQGQVAISSLLGTFTTPIIFGTLVAFAIKYRRRPEIHKRLILLAMIAIIWPAFFRFRHYFPSVPSPEIYFGALLPDLMVVLAMVWDKISFGRIHPVYLIAGTFLIVDNITETLLFDSKAWQAAANWLSGFFL